MASRRGMRLRADAAQRRIDAALAELAQGRPELPPMPDRSRDPYQTDAVRLEWTAEVLEALANDRGGQPAPTDPGPEDDVVARYRAQRLDQLKALAVERGIDPDEVKGLRAKDDVIVRLLELEDEA